MGKLRGLALFVAGLALVVAFQNCSSEEEGGGVVQQSSVGPAIAAQSESASFNSSSPEAPLNLFVTVADLTAEPLMTYQWYKDGVAITENGNANILELGTLPVDGPAAAGTYYVEINDESGTSRSADIVIGFTKTIFTAECQGQTGGTGYYGRIQKDISQGYIRYTGHSLVIVSGTITPGGGYTPGGARRCGINILEADGSVSARGGYNPTYAVDGGTTGSPSPEQISRSRAVGCTSDDNGTSVRGAFVIYTNPETGEEQILVNGGGGRGSGYFNLDDVLASGDYCVADFI